MSDKNWHTMNAQEVIDELKTRLDGLSEKEVKERLKEHGLNEIKQEKKINPLKIFFNQFKDFLIIILLIATVISFALGEVIDAIVIFIIIILCAILGFVQEYKSEKAIEALKKLSTPKAKVIRNGKLTEINANEISIGDIVVLETGDRVPADGRIIEEINLQTDESILTGESLPVKKTIFPLSDAGIPIADRKNMVYAGTIVTYGHGKMVVTSTGMKTEFGKIAEMIQSMETEKTPLEKKLEDVGKKLGITALAICFIIFLIGVFRGNDYLEMFIWSVSLAVAAVPEALPAVVTGTLAIGTERMAKKKAVVRKLPAVETLGCVDVICSDKTGTLTKNEMTVRRIYDNNSFIDVTGEGYKPEGVFKKGNKIIDPTKDHHLKLLLTSATLCNDAILEKDDNKWKIIGDPTEGALIVASTKAGINTEKLKNENPRAAEIQFDMVRKRMTTIHPFKNGKLIVYTKGAPEIILSLSTKILEKGKVVKLTQSKKKELMKVVDKMANDALRVLAFAYRHISRDELPPSLENIEPDKIEDNLIFIGFMGMIDPPRKEAKEAVKLCMDAGIRPIIVTGDHAITTLAIAKEIGLVDVKETIKSGSIITGEILDKITDDELKKIIDEVKIFARVSPHHKLRIVNILKEKGHIVAMTGDGINDAPALKSANIGIAMGISGTEVTKEASDMILMDDNFSTIVNAVKEGRIIYDNIKKYLTFLIRCNIGEILILTSSFFLGLPLPLVAIQILLINLITDGLPALALGVDPPDPEIMKRKPRRPDESIFSKKMLFFMGLVSLIIFVTTITIFNFYVKNYELVKAQTIAFSIIVMFQLFDSYNSRTFDESLTKVGVLSNKWLNLAFIFSLIFLIAIIHIQPLTNLFHTTPLTINEWLIVIIASSSVLIVGELVKPLLKKWSF